MLTSPSALLPTPAVERRYRGTLGKIVRTSRRVNDFWMWLGRRRRTSVLVVAGAAGLIGCVYYLQCGFPVPEFDDEFSYLLAAETFASGRVTNPTHPMWKHFETTYVIEQPTYASVYPVAQGLILGAALRITGHAWWGVWFSVCVMCGAICWMLQQWLPPQWALIGGLLSLRLATTYWMRSYWGGAVAAAAGALLLGAAARMLHQPTKKSALLMAVAIAVLANSRPYEGLVLTLSVAGWYLFRFVKMPGTSRALVFRRAILPFAVVLLATGGSMAYYNWRVTGSPVTLPYTVLFRTYLYRRMFVWQKNRPEPAYRHLMLKAAYESLERPDVPRLEFARAKFQYPLQTYFGAVLVFLVPLTFGPWSWGRRIRPLAAFSGVMFLAIAAEYWAHPHYSAPAAAALYGVMVQTLRRVNSWGRSARVEWGSVATQTLIVGAIAMFLIRFAVQNSNGSALGAFAVERPRILRQLEMAAPKNLVIVRYSLQRHLFREWVHNSANIDKASVVWARDMSPAENAELIRYFSGRKAWILESDHLPHPLLRPYAP